MPVQTTLAAVKVASGHMYLALPGFLLLLLPSLLPGLGSRQLTLPPARCRWCQCLQLWKGVIRKQQNLTECRTQCPLPGSIFAPFAKMSKSHCGCAYQKVSPLPLGPGAPVFEGCGGEHWVLAAAQPPSPVCLGRNGDKSSLPLGTMVEMMRTTSYTSSYWNLTHPG